MFDSIEDILLSLKNKKLCILLDGEERENEGDLIIPADYITPEIINFMSKHGRGLICLAIADSIAKRLMIDLQPRRNSSESDTAFTMSIEAARGISTGISASDRAYSIKVVISPSSTPNDIKIPGHIFPIIANSGGVLERPGHTEASVELAKLLNLTPAAVICEIINDDGTMARRDDLITFAKLHNIKVSTITSLIDYIKQNTH